MAARVSADDYRDWGLLLRSLWDRTDQDYQGHIDPEDEAALVLVECLETEQMEKLAFALLEYNPGLMGRFSEELLGELKEEMYRRMETGEVSGTPVELVEAIEANWKQEG